MLPDERHSTLYVKYRTDQELLPRVDRHGRDHGAVRRVLLRMGDRVAAICPRHDVFGPPGMRTNRLTRRITVPSTFSVYDERKPYQPFCVVVGRVTHAKLEPLLPELQAFFSCDRLDARFFNIRQTIVSISHEQSGRQWPLPTGHVGAFSYGGPPPLEAA